MPTDPLPGCAVFLDRDGTLMEEVHYCARAGDVRVMPEASAALRSLKSGGFLNFIVTNQAGIGRGFFTLADYEKVQAELLRQLGPGLIDATYFCPDHPDRPTPRRKPGIGMIEEAARDFSLDLTRCFLVGDKAIDIECGQRAGLRTILVATGYGATEICNPDFRAANLATAAEWIVGK